MSESDTKKRTRSELSSVSESDSSMNTTPVKSQEKKKQKPNDKEKYEQNESMKEVQSELKKINKELKDVMKKKDIKELIKDTILEMKKEVLACTEKRIEILEFKMAQKDKEISSTEKKFEVLESQVFQKDKEIDILKEDINKLRKEIADQNIKIATQNTDLERYKRELRLSERKTDEYLNDYEQYNRRNNIRITGIPEEMFPKLVIKNTKESDKENTDDNSDDKTDSGKLAETYAMKAAEQNEKTENKLVEQIPENADQTTSILIKKINKYIPGLNLTTADIDISHRLGKKNEIKSRPIIAKFGSRLIKDKIMRNRKLFPKSMSVMDDLTAENYDVLQSLKYKKPDTVQAAWYRNGKIFMKDHSQRISHVPYKDYTLWTKIPWPARRHEKIKHN